MQTHSQKGQCLCGSVRFELTAEVTGASSCHCGQCRRQTGNYWASGMVPREHLHLLQDDGLTWFASSDDAERGFCAKCGSVLFWRKAGEDHCSVSLGALDAPHDVAIERHIFVGDKGSYYEIADGLPQEGL